MRNLDYTSVVQISFFCSRDTLVFKGHRPQMELLWLKQGEVCPEDKPSLLAPYSP